MKVSFASPYPLEKSSTKVYIKTYIFQSHGFVLVLRLYTVVCYIQVS